MPILIDYDQIRASISMERVLAEYGVDVRHGKAICPFHNDKRPSMKVYRDGYYCFACGNGGDAITFVARMDGIRNAQAALKVAEMAGMIIPQSDYRAAKNARKAARERREAKEVLQAAENKYKALCAELHVLQAAASDAVPYSDIWCNVQREMLSIEGELDELYEQLRKS